MGKTHKVERGQTIIDIAGKYGFRNWEPIWQDSANDSLRSKRDSPFLLAEGDQLSIPDKKPKEFSCQTNLRHSFRVRNLKELFRTRLLDSGGQPLPGRKYEFTAAGKTKSGTSDGDGVLMEEVPVTADKATLKVWMIPGDESSAVSWDVKLGYLEPIDTVHGLKARLNNLGYDCDTDKDEMDDKTKAALKLFQSDHGLPVTGEADDATKDALRSVHDLGAETS